MDDASQPESPNLSLLLSLCHTFILSYNVYKKKSTILCYSERRLTGVNKLATLHATRSRERESIMHQPKPYKFPNFTLTVSRKRGLVYFKEVTGFSSIQL